MNHALGRAAKWFARRRFEWCVDYFDGRRIQGWVGSKIAPKSSCLLAFRSGNKVIATTLANIPRRDVALLGYGAAGFNFMFETYVEGPVALAAISPEPRSSWWVLEPELEPGLGCGAIEFLSLTGIRGWALAGAGAEVALWEGDRKIAATQANLKRQDVAEGYGFDNPYVGFDLRLPVEATAFSNGRFTLKAHSGAKASIIRKDILFTDIDPGFERQLTLDPRSSSWA
jgi:hypothetical protein